MNPEEPEDAHPTERPSQEKPSTQAEVEHAIREVMERVLLLEPGIAAAVDFDQSGVLTSLGVTSIDAFELIVSVEERFGFEFDDQELNPGLVDPLNKLVTAVSSKLNVTS